RLQGNRNGHGRLHHQIATTFSSEIEDGCLPGKHSTFGRRNNRRETSGPPRLNAFIGEADFVGGGSPRGCPRAILGTPRRWPLPCLAASRGSRNANVGEGVDQTGINNETLAVDNPSLVWNCDIFSDRADDPAR